MARRPKGNTSRQELEIDHPGRAHGAAGRRKIWAARLGFSESQIAWWSLQGRFSKIVERALPAWKTASDADGHDLRREVQGSGPGEAALFAVVASYVHAAADSPSQLELLLNGTGSVEIRLHEAEDGLVTPDEGCLAFLLDHVVKSRRRKRSRFRHLWRPLAAKLGLGPDRLPVAELVAGLEQQNWTRIERGERCVGVHQGYVFGGPNLAMFFTVQTLALLTHTWEDLRIEVGVTGPVASVIVYSHPWTWPPLDLFDALETVARLAEERGGEAQELETLVV